MSHAHAPEAVQTDLQRMAIMVAAILAGAVVVVSIPDEAPDRLATLTQAIGLSEGSGTGESSGNSEATVSRYGA